MTRTFEFLDDDGSRGKGAENGVFMDYESW